MHALLIKIASGNGTAAVGGTDATYAKSGTKASLANLHPTAHRMWKLLFVEEVQATEREWEVHGRDIVDCIKVRVPSRIELRRL